MKKSSSIIWGLVLVALGVILGGNAIGLLNVDVFFDGWWTLFIIVPSFAGIFNDPDKKGNFIALIVGILLLLACQDVIEFDLVLKLLVPTIIIVIGLSLIFRNVFHTKFNQAIKEINAKGKAKEEYCATFAAQDVKLGKEEFNGTTINVVFGGIKLDLRDAIIKEDVVINASSVFGGIDIIVPKNVAVKVKSNSIFGGVDNKVKADGDEKVTIYVNATCLFGGVDIK